VLLTLLSSFVLFSGNLAAQTMNRRSTLLLRNPDIHGDQIVFQYGDDLWTAQSDGSHARALTSGAGRKSDPHFSPDGQWIAYTGTYDGNEDVYVLPATGGEPRRLTYHPARDEVLGWAPDSTRVLFRSDRDSYIPNYYTYFNRLFTVSLRGDLPSELPLPMGEQGAYSSDASHLVYVPFTINRPITAWKHYRGGRMSRIWIADLSDSSTTEIPRGDGNDFNPMWVGDRIYFLSDRDGRIALYRYDLASQKVSLAAGAERDIKSAATDGRNIILEQLGALRILDLKSGEQRLVDVRITSDLPALRPRFKNVAEEIINYGISPTGVRAVFEAHGEIFTVADETGDVRNLTRSPGVADRDPAWSPNGKWIAFFSDGSGEYQLVIASQDGSGEPRRIGLDSSPSFYYRPRWSPDSKKIVYNDKHMVLWYVDVRNGKPVKVDQDYYNQVLPSFDATWSPDSQWIAYTRQLPSHMHAAVLYSTATGQRIQLTDGMSDARWPVFDGGGQFLYFSASTDIGPTAGWLDLSSFNRPISRNVYLVVLRKDVASPLAPDTREERVDAGKPVATDDPSRKAPEVRVDSEEIAQRILPLPLPTKNYTGLQAGAAGSLFVLESARLPEQRLDFGLQSVSRFDLASRRSTPVVEGVNEFITSFDGTKMLYRKGHGKSLPWVISAVPASAAGQPLKLDHLVAWIEPGEEWKQMYREAWRIQRDYFYDPNLHGVDWKAAMPAYTPYLAAAACADDIYYLMVDMFGELAAGHLFVYPPASSPSDQPRTGLLGADYKVENGRYRFARVLRGESWDPDLQAPLTAPGVNVSAGDYLLAVNGRELRADENVYALFQGTAGQQTVLKVGPRPDGENARTITVVPIASEGQLRNRSWVAENRRNVEELSGGRLGYLFLPDTGEAGYRSFNRYYFAQTDKQGIIIDQRFNGGGLVGDYFIEYLKRRPLSYWVDREGHTFTAPAGIITGPKVMLVNEYSSSGGDALAWSFRYEKIGTLVGTTTWGGLIGIGDYPVLLDTGMVTAPNYAFFSPAGKWEVENHGVTPDVVVELSPKAWRSGNDTQLETAVAVALEQLKQHPLSVPNQPTFPNYHAPTSGVAQPSGRQ
jgi:tricorn protease